MNLSPPSSTLEFFTLKCRPRRELRISSARDDRMGARISTPKKPLRLPTNPKQSLVQKLTHKNIPCQISKPSLVVLFLQNYASGNTRVPPQIFRLFWIPQKITTSIKLPKKILYKFPFPQHNLRIEDLKPKKVIRSSPHLKSRVPPPPPRHLEV